MKEQFVPYELTKELINKGFAEECLGYYHASNNELIINNIPNYSLEKDNLGIGAPLWQQVIEWLREKHDLDIMIRQTKKDGTAYYKITKIETEDKIKGYSNFCNTVNSARQSAIEHALTLI